MAYNKLEDAKTGLYVYRKNYDKDQTVDCWPLVTGIDSLQALLIAHNLDAAAGRGSENLRDANAYPYHDGYVYIDAERDEVYQLAMGAWEDTEVLHCLVTYHHDTTERDMRT